jgi:hypothetical protein
MVMGWFWLIVVVIVAAVVTIAALFDRRSRRRGLQSADGGASLTDERERIRNARDRQSRPEIIQDISWSNDFNAGGPPTG